MVRRLIDRWRDPKPPDPWRELVRNSSEGIRSAYELISEIVDRAGGLSEKISAGEEPVALFDPREAESKWEAILSGVEHELRRVCGLYDYRQLLFVSRLCSGIPALRKRDPDMGSTRVRSQNADRWVLRCAVGSTGHDYLRVDEDRYSVGPLPATIYRDAIKLHVLADLHNVLSITRMMYNLMRLAASSVNSVLSRSAVSRISKPLLNKFIIPSREGPAHYGCVGQNHSSRIAAHDSYRNSPPTSGTPNSSPATPPPTWVYEGLP